MRFNFITIIYIILSLQTQAQKGSSEQKEAMQKLYWMKGNWSGTSTLIINGQKRITQIRESVRPALDGTILQISVRATDADSFTNKQSLAYTSFSIISFDAKNKTYRWTSWRTNGNDYEQEPFTVGNNSFEYTSKENNRTIRYNANVAENGAFLETGEYLQDGSEGTPFVTMKLVKSKAK